MLGKISTKHNERTITTWNNGAVGAIEDIDSNCIFRFIQYLIDDNGSCRSIYKPHEERQQPIVCYGFVGWLLRNRTRATLDIFDSYYNIRKETYQKAHEDDADVWQRDLAKEFAQVHEAEERKYIEYSKALFDYLPDCDIQFISERCENYLKYMQSKLATDEKQNEVQEVKITALPIEETYHESKPIRYDGILDYLKAWNESDHNKRHIQIIDADITTEEFRHKIRTADMDVITAVGYRDYLTLQLAPYFSEEWMREVERNADRTKRNMSSNCNKLPTKFRNKFNIKKYEIK